MDPALRKRLTFGPLMLAGLVGLLAFDWQVEVWTETAPGARDGVAGVGLTLLLLCVAPLAVRELARLFAAENVKPYRVIASFGTALMLVHAFFTQFDFFAGHDAASLALIVVGVMLSAAYQRARYQQSQQAIVSMAGTVLATLYLGGLAWFMVALRVADGAYQGTIWHVVMLLLTVKFTDIGAFFVGRNFGRHKLIPWLSPGKTWEGLAGGLVAAGLVGAFCATQILFMPWWKGLVFGIVIGGIGQVGDLLESMMKRDADVKDSGSLIPGFGGVLDVIDSPLLAAPVAYVVFTLFAGR